MPSGGKPLRLGPFVGGLNTGSDPTAIADAELVTCLNMELDIDGSLVSRPPIQEVDGPVGSTERVRIICEAVFSGAHYLIGSNTQGVYFYINGLWSLITATFEATDAVQYAGFVYFTSPPNSGQTSGKWNPSAGYAAVAAIPRGRSLCIHKERLFVSRGVDATTNDSRLQFSNVGDFDTWSASDFIDIGQGDGTKLIDLIVYQDNLLLFKDESTYVLAYDIRPTDAVIRKISSTLGVDGQHCVVNYENQVYTLHNSWVYEIVNYDFNRLNTKVPFVFDSTAPGTLDPNQQVTLSILADRIICRYFSKIYVYGMRTQKFTEWTATEDVLKFFGPITTLHIAGGDQYYAGSCIMTFSTMLRLYDKATSITSEKVLIPDPTTIDTFTRTLVDQWGSADTGEVWTVSLGVAADEDVNGTQATTSLGAVNVKRAMGLSLSIQNPDISLTVVTPVISLGTGGWITQSVIARLVDANNYYEFRVEWKEGGSLGVAIYKVVAGATTSLSGSVVGTYTANELHKLRVHIEGNVLKAKVWKVSAAEPGGWTVIASDSTFPNAGLIFLQGVLLTGNTSTLPVVVRWDDLNIGNNDATKRDIECKVITKNFDMAVPNQFKRLWWWGADVSTDRDIVGKATPIVVAFNATWSALAARKWNSLNTWSQPLTEPTSITTTVMSGTGTARRFAKFLKALRYRQINFEVDLKTEGSTVDGPAKLFTMMAVTSTKETVVKALS